MKLQSVKYNEHNDKWYSLEYIPDNPREILLYTKEFGTTSGYYMINDESWYSLRWDSVVNPLYWREMPRYESKNSL